MGSGVLRFELIARNRLVLGIEQWLHQPCRVHPLQKFGHLSSGVASLSRSNHIKTFLKEVGLLAGFVSIMANHFGDELLQRCRWSPAKFFSGFGRVAEKCFHFCWSEVAGIDSHHYITGIAPSSKFFDPLAFP